MARGRERLPQRSDDAVLKTPHVSRIGMIPDVQTFEGFSLKDEELVSKPNVERGRSERLIDIQ